MLKRKIVTLIFSVLMLCTLAIGFSTVSSAINLAPIPDMSEIRWVKSSQVEMGKKGAIFFTSAAKNEVGVLQVFPIDSDEEADRVLGFFDYMQNLDVNDYFYYDHKDYKDYFELFLMTDMVNIVLCDDWNTGHFILNHSFGVSIDLGGHTWKTKGYASTNDGALIKMNGKYFPGFAIANGTMTIESGYYYNLAYVCSGELSVDNVTFRNCNTTCSYSILSTDYGANLNLTNVTFENCSTGSEGCVSVTGSAVIRDCLFSNCKGKYGAILMEEEDAYANITNCTFDSCHGSYGSAAYVDDDFCLMRFTNCSFIDCTSDEDGGVFYVNGDDASLYFAGGCALYCSTEGDGGFCFINGNDCFLVGDADTNEADSYGSRMAVVGCYADGDGGAVYTSVASGCGNGAYIAGFIFSTCYADDWGGAVCLCGTDNSVRRCDFIGNHISGYGGGLYIQTDTAHITDCTFEKNSAGKGGHEIYVNDDCSLTNINIYSDYTDAYALYLDVGSDRVSRTNVTFGLNTGYSGKGTEKDPYLIANAYDLIRLSCNLVNTNYAGKYFKQIRDIGPLAASIGGYNTNYPFSGIYDGNGYSVTVYARFDGGYNGLFAHAKNAVIKNVTVKGNIAGQPYAAGVCGCAENTRIENCRNESTINAGGGAGGIVGLASSTTVTGCSNSGYVYSWASGSFSIYGSGGIVGAALDNVAIEHCDNNGPICGQYCVGGILGSGYEYYTGRTINDCRNNAVIYAFVQFAGGIVGKSGQIVVSNCTTTKYSSAAAQISCAGGIIGSINCTGSDRTVRIENCANIGHCGTPSCAYVGGILGYGFEGAVTLENCFNADKIEGCFIDRRNTADAIATGNVNAIHCFYLMGSTATGFGKGFFPEECEKTLRKEMNRYVDEKHPDTWIRWSEGLAKYNHYAAVNPFNVGIEELIGKGTEKDPYIIESDACLTYIADELEDGTSYKGKYFLLVRNVVSSSGTPIGSAAHPFEGFLEGNNHSIEYHISGVNDAGLFAVIKGATLQNLTLKGSVETSKTEASCNAGALAAVSYDSVIRGCTSTVTVDNLSSSGACASGGFVGRAQNTDFYDCVCNTTVYAEGGTTGGIAGEASGTSFFDLCKNNQSGVAGPGISGGIVGSLSGRAVVRNCVSDYYAVIEGGTETGGIIGLLRADSEAAVLNCASHASVYTDLGHAGGILAFAQKDGGSLLVKNCFASGDVCGWDFDSVYAMIAPTDSFGEYVDCYYTAMDSYAAEMSFGEECTQKDAKKTAAASIPYSILQGNAVDPANEGWMEWKAGNSSTSNKLITLRLEPQTYSIVEAQEVTEEKVRIFSEGDYIIRPAIDIYQCVEIAGGVTNRSPGGNLQLYDSELSDGKVFTLIKDYSTGTYKIEANHSGLVLDVAGGSTRNGTNVSQWTDHGGSNQRWTFENAGNGYVYIRSALGTYLDVAGGRTANGTNVQTYSLIEGNETQMFKLEKVTADTTLVPVYPAEGEYVINSLVDPFACLDVSGGVDAKNNGDNVQIWNEKTSFAKTFTLIRDRETDSYKIVANQSGLVLDVVGGNGPNVWQWEDLGANNQRWIFESAGDGMVYIRSLSGRFLEVENGKSADGTNVRVGDFTGSEAQTFELTLQKNLVSGTRIRPAEGEYEILSALDNGKCLDIEGGSSARGNGSDLHLWTESTADAKKFLILWDEESDAYKIVAKHSRRVMDIEGGSYKSGTRIYQWEDCGGTNQRWVFEYAGDGNVYIRSLNGNYMDVENGKTADDTNVKACAFTGDTNQVFRLKLFAPNSAGAEVHPEEGEYVIYSDLASGKCLDIAGGVNAQNKGDVLQLWDTSSGAKHYLIVWDDAKCSYQIIAKQSGLPLDVKDSNTSNGTQIRQWEDNGYDAQRWIFEYASDGSVFIRSVLGPYMDVDNAGTANGTKIQLYEFNGTKAQSFRLEKTAAYSEKTSFSPAEGEYVIQSEADRSLCFDVAGGKTMLSNGDNVWLWSESESNAKNFVIRYDAGTGAYKIVAKHSGLVVDHNIAGTTVENVYQWKDNGTGNQRWQFEYAGSGCVFIRSQNGLYLTIDNSDPTKGTNISAGPFTGDVTQKFRLKRVPANTVGAAVQPADGDYEIVFAANPTLCFESAGGSKVTMNGTNIQLWSESQSTAKNFLFRYDEKTNAYRIVIRHSGLVLDYYIGGTVTGNVYQWTDNSTDNQRWVFEYAGEDRVYIRSRNGMYLTVDSLNPGNGTNIIAGPFTGDVRQEFCLKKVG